MTLLDVGIFGEGEKQDFSRAATVQYKISHKTG
jgi:hypothetical protein